MLYEIIEIERHENLSKKLTLTSLHLPKTYKIDPETFELVEFMPGGRGGDHIHPDGDEYFVALTELLLKVKNPEGNEEEELIMNSCEGSVLKIYRIPRGVAHAVINTSDRISYLLEWASAKLDTQARVSFPL